MQGDPSTTDCNKPPILKLTAPLAPTGLPDSSLVYNVINHTVKRICSTLSASCETLTSVGGNIPESVNRRTSK